jgi:hypothetical protein
LLQTLKMLDDQFFVVWNLNFLRRIHRHFWIKSIPKLGFKIALGIFDSFNDSMRVNKFDVANSPKMFISSVKKCSMFIKFQMATSTHNYDKFSLEENMFFIWPGGGFPLLVCGISQTKSVDFPFLGMTSSLLYFLQSPKLMVSFFCVSSHFTTAVFVLLSMLIICPRWIQCFLWFSTLTWSPTHTHKASKFLYSFFFAPQEREMIQDDAILHKQLPSPCGHSSSPIMSFIWPTFTYWEVSFSRKISYM